jgi:hypothetical protein
MTGRKDRHRGSSASPVRVPNDLVSKARLSIVIAARRGARLELAAISYD